MLGHNTMAVQKSIFLFCELEYHRNSAVPTFYRVVNLIKLLSCSAFSLSVDIL